MISIPDLLIQSLENVWSTLTHTWPFLLISILISAGLRLYIHPEKASAFLSRYRGVGIVGATFVAVTTPLCSGGTTAVILGMLASTIPWAPIVAFMVASPLTSPEELVYSAGLFGWPFAIAFFASSILLGLLGGMLAEFCEARGWFANQSRFNWQAAHGRVGLGKQNPAQFANPIQAQGSNGSPAAALLENDCLLTPAVLLPGASADASSGMASCQSMVANTMQRAGHHDCPQDPGAQPITAQQWALEVVRTGKQLLGMFLGFTFLGYVLNGLIPPAWVAAIFGNGNAYSVPLAATLGLPFYINTEGSLPLVRALIDGGMSQGAALAFLISGAGTSVGAVAGALTIARWRVIGLVVGTLLVGAVVMGYVYDFLLAAHMFG